MYSFFYKSEVLFSLSAQAIGVVSLEKLTLFCMGAQFPTFTSDCVAIACHYKNKVVVIVYRIGCDLSYSSHSDSAVTVTVIYKA